MKNYPPKVSLVLVEAEEEGREIEGKYVCVCKE